MKMSQELFTALKDAIAPKLVPETIRAYEGGRFPRSESVKDLDLRFQFDLFHAVSRQLRDIERFDVELYQLNSDHIATALRRIVPTLERKF